MPLLSLHFLKTALKAVEYSRPRLELSLNGYQRAGVLVPVVHRDTGVELLFTKRTDRVETHKGQISFPGGIVDREDADISSTALRELEEELGISRSIVEVVGLLDDHATPTGFIITPVVGMLESLPEMRPNTEEVEESFLVPLSFFADPANGRREYRRLKGENHEVWFYDYRGKTIWGATAMIVRSLLDRTGILPVKAKT
ncbi:MAG: CoA pyrophosphatase [Ignavibacteria bacterium]|nr:CoA pyrophosphatase [Ignavibacteria bacterium]